MNDIVPGEDPVELRPVRRITATSKPSMPGIKGGQGRSGAEIEAGARDLALIVGLAVVALLGIGAAELIAKGAAALGAWFAS